VKAEEPLRAQHMPSLGKRFQTRLRLARGIVDVGPLVDVVLLLFLFFIMNASFVVQPGITVQLPATSFSSGTEYGSMTVLISQENMVFFNDERTTLQGLASAFAQAHHLNPEATLMIQADGRVPHKTIVDIYNMAMQSGIRKINLATRVATRQGAAP